MKAVLQVDPEPALRLLADKIAVRASASTSKLRQHQASAAKALVQLGEHKTLWKVRFDACVSSWKHDSIEVTLPWMCGRGW